MTKAIDIKIDYVNMSSSFNKMNMSAVQRLKSLPTGPSEQAATSENKAPLDGDHVLHIDDNPTIRTLIKKTMTRAKAEITSLTGAGDLINQLKQRHSKNPIDVILSDHQFSKEYDSSDVIEWGKQQQPPVPVVVLTGNEQTYGKYAKEGQAVLLKPASMRDLRATLAAAIQEAANTAAKPETS
jgi:CheY-like chemotaxis protein